MTTAPLHAPQPARHPGGGCRTCRWNEGDWIAAGAHVLCRQGIANHVHAQPAVGCVMWLREPGAD